jgi:2',3'-cyclic-nucleotide 2'-phosphodiesterase (5'-nucleotidase family)
LTEFKTAVDSIDPVIKELNDKNVMKIILISHLGYEPREEKKGGYSVEG